MSIGSSGAVSSLELLENKSLHIGGAEFGWETLEPGADAYNCDSQL